MAKIFLNHVISICFITFLLATTGNCFSYGGGMGEPNDPYKIKDVNDLLHLAADANDYDKCFILVNDINLSDYTFDKSVIAPAKYPNEEYSGISFSGIFDGNNKIIYNLSIGTDLNYFIGFFGSIGEGSKIRNLSLENVNINGKGFVGGLVGSNFCGSILNCSCIGQVEGMEYCIGGLVGTSRSGVTSNCKFVGSVKGMEIVGGLIGGDRYGSIADCNVFADVNGVDVVGGLVGSNGGTEISDSYSSGAVKGHDNVGGLVGRNFAEISNCHSTSEVISTGDFVGGLLGYSIGGYGDADLFIDNCYTTGNISGFNYTGGLIGYHEASGVRSYDTVFKGCYTTGNVSGSNYIGGIAGQATGIKIVDCHTSGNVAGCDNVGGLMGCCSVSIVYKSKSSSTVNGSRYVGGLIGMACNVELVKCYANCSVNAVDMCGGGLIGMGGDGIILDCYTDGFVNSNYLAGGLVGENYIPIINCYSSAVFNGIDSSNFGGLCGDSHPGASQISCYFLDFEEPYRGGGTPLTDDQMKDTASYINWDFSYTDGNDAVWFMPEDGYPILTWQISSSDIYTDGKNNFKDFAVFSNYWLREDCGVHNNYCDWADLDFSGDVGMPDLIELMSHWLEEVI